MAQEPNSKASARAFLDKMRNDYNRYRFTNDLEVHLSKIQQQSLKEAEPGRADFSDVAAKSGLVMLT